MVRVAGLHDQIDAGIETPLQDGRTPTRDARRDPRDGRASTSRARRAASSDDLRPALAEHGIRIVGYDDVDAERARARSTSASGARSSRC